MKALILILLSFVAISGSAWSYYDENEQVRELAHSGRFERLHSACESEGLGSDALVRDGEKLCLDILPIPSSVESEVEFMKSNELENESDYDQRIVSIFHFSSPALQQESVEIKDILELYSFVNVKANASELNIESEVINNASFSEFDELFVDLFYKVNSNSQSFIKSAFEGELVQIIKFEQGVELYPGGGFYVSHYLVISAKHAMYIKFSWWNS